MVVTRRATDRAVRENLARAQRYMSQYANSKRRDMSFSVGDQVMLATTNLPLPASAARKLAPKWIGPLRVLERIGAVAYRLQLPDTLARLHPVFHVGLLRPFSGTAPPQRPPIFTCDEADEFEVDRLTAHRTVRGTRQFLVSWKGYPLWDSTWEPEANLKGCPDLLAAYKTEHGLR